MNRDRRLVAVPPHERRWPASLAVLGALGLQLLVPAQLTAGPRWIPPICEAALLVPLVLTNPRHLRKDQPYLRHLALGLVGVLVAVNAAYLVRLVGYLAGGGRGGTVLVHGALLIWVTNVVAFAIGYWEMDRGGPFARMPAHPRPAVPPDLLFPQMVTRATGWVPEGWLPGFTDYLYVAFTTATAFSPTDTMPLSARAKLLMTTEASVSLLTIAIVAGRAVNVL
ncbi:MAG: hypothetical protein ACRDPK_11470 [Carbonactinosporaceae bacterium]